MDPGAYAPELNPVEQVWNHTKYGQFFPDHGCMKNFSPLTTIEKRGRK